VGSGFWVQGSGFWVQGFKGSRFKVQGSRFWVRISTQPLPDYVASLIEKETLKKRILRRRINIEYRRNNTHQD
jgi:hypothetical protein